MFSLKRSKQIVLEWGRRRDCAKEGSTLCLYNPQPLISYFRFHLYKRTKEKLDNFIQFVDLTYSVRVLKFFCNVFLSIATIGFTVLVFSGTQVF